MTARPDEYYIEQTLAGNTQAFTYLVDKYQNMVFTIAVKMVKSREEAEDVAQEVFVKCYRSLGNFRGTSRFSTWLYKIAYNYSIDRVHEGKRKVATGEMDASELQISTEVDALSVLEKEERKAIIKKMIDQLQDDEQMIITLYYYEDMSVKEISEIMDISLSNVKVKLFRSRNKLMELSKSFVILE